MCTSTDTLPCRRVSFATTENGDVKATRYKSAYSRSSMSDHILWWPKIQRAVIKKDAFTEAATARGFFVEDGTCARSTYTKILARVYQAKLKGKEIPLSLQAEFYFEISLGHTVRGLEKFIVDEIKKDRIQRRKRVTDGILYIQRWCRKKGTDDDLRTNMIRLASESLTQGAKRIAKMYGDADQFASQFQASGITIHASPLFF